MNRNYWGEDCCGEQERIDRDFDVKELKQKAWRWIVGGLFAIFALVWYGTTYAQTPPFFNASVTSGQAPLSTVLTWNAGPEAVSCIAGNTTGWNGSVPTSGTRTLTGIGVNLTLSLSCVTRGSAEVSWVPGAPVPGATVTAWRVLHGASATTLTETIDVPNAAARTYTVTGLAPGNRFFAVRAVAGAQESVNSNVASKNITGGSWSQSIDITILPPPVPNPPVIQVTDALAYEIYSPQGVLTARAIGVVQLGAPCLPETKQVGTITYNRVASDRVDRDVRLNQPNWRKNADVKLWARCG